MSCVVRKPLGVVRPQDWKEQARLSHTPPHHHHHNHYQSRPHVMASSILDKETDEWWARTELIAFKCYFT